MRRAAGVAGGLLPVARARRAAAQLADVPPDCLPVLQVDGLPADLLEAPLGRVDARAGAAAARCIEHAVRAGAARARRRRSSPRRSTRRRSPPPASPTPATPRCCRRSPPAAAALPPVRMMLANDELRTVLVTIHLSLRQAIDAVTFDAVLETIRIAARAPRRAGASRGRASRSPGSTRMPARAACSATRRRRIIAPAVRGGARRRHRRERPVRARHGVHARPQRRRVTRASSTSSSR